MASLTWKYSGRTLGMDTMTFTRADEWFSVAVGWRQDRFVGWYVNLQVPVTRNEGAFDTMDLILDVVVSPDRSWQEKDRPDFDAAISRGIFDADIAERVLAEQYRALERLHARDEPFDDRWAKWTHPLVEPLVLPLGYDHGIMRA